MGREHEPGVVFEAQELYCVNRLSFERIAEMLGVADSTVRRWADKYDWRSKREHIAQELADISANLVTARARMLKAVIESADPQAAYAVSALESLALKQTEAARKGLSQPVEAAGAIASESLHISTVAEAREALSQAILSRLSGLLSGGGFDLASIRGVQAALALAERLEQDGQDGKKDSGTKGWSPETVEAIRAEILGIRK